MPSQETIFATEYKSIPAQIGVDEAQGIVECFVAGIGNKDSVGDICLPGSFNASLKRRKPRVVWGHNWNEPIGKVLEIYEVPPNDPRLPMKMKRAGIGGLFARVQFNLRSERGREAFNNVAFFGEEQEWSIGYKTLDAVFDPVQQANMLKEVELYEVSPVLHGANQLTGTISIKSEDPEQKADQPCWPGYTQVGMKKGKNGKMVPNCVPADGEKSAEERIRDPKGGLTAAGRKYFKRTQGANLKPGVKGPADTPEKMRRKGSFLTRFYTNPSGPLVGENGKPTRLALAAAAWGEPVPRTRSDAAELAAKGRRLLERYENAKEKGHPMAMMIPNRIYEDQDMANPSSGFVGQLAREISRKFNGKVKIRTADKNMVIFDLMNSAGDVDTLRLGYHYEDGEFMFGNIEPVRPETIYMPVGKPQSMPGNAYVGDDDDDFGDVFGGVSMKPAKGDCGCGCKGSGSCGSEPTFESWDDFKSANPGMHLFVKSDYEDDDLLDYVAPIAKYHGFAVKSLTDGIVVPYMDDIDDEGYGALINALNGIDEKGVGRKLRALGRMADARFDPNARDADADQLIQEGTQFERPAKPKTPIEWGSEQQRQFRESQRERGFGYSGPDPYGDDEKRRMREEYGDIRQVMRDMALSDIANRRVSGSASASNSPRMMPPMRPRPAREPQREPIKPPLRPQVPSTPRRPSVPTTPEPVREPARTRVAGSMAGKKPRIKKTPKIQGAIDKWNEEAIEAAYLSRGGGPLASRNRQIQGERGRFIRFMRQSGLIDKKGNINPKAESALRAWEYDYGMELERLAGTGIGTRPSLKLLQEKEIGRFARFLDAVGLSSSFGDGVRRQDIANPKKPTRPGFFDFSAPLKPINTIPGQDGEVVIPGNPGMSKRMTDARIYKMRAEQVMSLDEVAKKMNMSRADVRQAEMRHMQAMRNAGVIGDETDKEKLARKIYERRMANKESLEQVARDLGMKREQVRQLEMRHAAKLRDSQEKMDAIIMRGGGNPKGRRVSGSVGAGRRKPDDESNINIGPYIPPRDSDGNLLPPKITTGPYMPPRDQDGNLIPDRDRIIEYGFEETGDTARESRDKRPSRRNSVLDNMTPKELEEIARILEKRRNNKPSDFQPGIGDGSDGTGDEYRERFAKRQRELERIATESDGRRAHYDWFTRSYKEGPDPISYPDLVEPLQPQLFNSARSRRVSGSMSAEQPKDKILKIPPRKSVATVFEDYTNVWSDDGGDFLSFYTEKFKQLNDQWTQEDTVALLRTMIDPKKIDNWLAGAQDPDELGDMVADEIVKDFKDRQRSVGNKNQIMPWPKSVTGSKKPKKKYYNTWELGILGDDDHIHWALETDENPEVFKKLIVTRKLIDRVEGVIKTQKRSNNRISGSMSPSQDPRKRIIPASQFSRNQNQAIDWGRKQTGFIIVRRIIERFDKNKALSQADIDKLQQLWKDYGPR